ncbi:MAG: hypothetical protein ACI9DF_005767 [Verrucomicrobiales bacterium]|jgi:hypothetical protein
MTANLVEHGFDCLCPHKLWDPWWRRTGSQDDEADGKRPLRFGRDPSAQPEKSKELPADDENGSKMGKKPPGPDQRDKKWGGVFISQILFVTSVR